MFVGSHLRDRFHYATRPGRLIGMPATFHEIACQLERRNTFIIEGIHWRYEMKTYRPAPMDKVTLGVTLFIFALLVFFIAFTFNPKSEEPMRFASIMMALVIAISWQVKANRYEINEDSIILVRGWPFRDIVIPLADVKKVEKVTISSKTIRTFGVGGLFSSTGWFWNKDIGHFFVSATNGYCIVLISNGKKWAISPENPDEFVADMSSRIGNRMANEDRFPH